LYLNFKIKIIKKGDFVGIKEKKAVIDWLNENVGEDSFSVKRITNEIREKKNLNISQAFVAKTLQEISYYQNDCTLIHYTEEENLVNFPEKKIKEGDSNQTD